MTFSARKTTSLPIVCRGQAGALAIAAALFFNCQPDFLPTDPEADFIEFQSVWQYCKAYSIYQDSAIYSGRIPEDPYAFAMPEALMSAIGDTLKGIHYTRYVEQPHPLPFRAAGPFSAASRPGGRTVYVDTLTPWTVLMTDSIFEEMTYNDFLACDSAVSSFPNIVVNLRNNRGGRLDVLDSIIEAMVPAGTAYIQTRERDFDGSGKQWVTLGWRDKKTKKGPRPAYSGKRFVVLMNGYTASASEILAAALYEGGSGPWEGGRVPLIGTRSYGKGIGQIQIQRRTRKLIQITFLQLRGVSERIGDYHWNGTNGGINVVSVPDSIKAITNTLTEWERKCFYAVKMLEPWVTPRDIKFPPERNPGFGPPLKSGCYATVSEDELNTRLKLPRGE